MASEASDSHVAVHIEATQQKENSNQSQSRSGIFISNTNSKDMIGPKLSIKLTENNYQVWNLLIEGVITANRLHRFLVSPQIPPKYKTQADLIANRVSDEYEAWIIQDSALFTWLLSTLSESVLPRVLSCKHSYQLWDTIHKHFVAIIKARSRQLRAELKNTKKGNRSISEYVLKIRAIANSLLAIGESITDRDQTDAILDGLPEEYNNFMMMMYSRSDIPELHELEALLYVQEAQLEKFKQELTTPAVSANVAHTSQGHGRGNSSYHRGRGRNPRGRGGPCRGGRGEARPTYQLCGKYGHSVMQCWHIFDESFVPQVPSPATNTNTNNVRANASDTESSSTPASSPQQPQANQVSAYTQELQIPSDIESQSWFADSGI